jgi:GrpE
MVEPENEPGTSESMESDVPAGTIVGEERRGYTLDGKILRYAEVIVAKNEKNRRRRQRTNAYALQ